MNKTNSLLKGIEKIVEDNLKLFYGADGKVENIGFNIYMLALDIYDNIELDVEEIKKIIIKQVTKNFKKYSASKCMNKLAIDLAKAKPIKIKEEK